MSVHDVLQEVLESGWLTEEERFVHYIEMTFAVIGESEGYPLTRDPWQVFLDAMADARCTHQERAYFKRQFDRAYEQHVASLLEELVRVA